MVLLQLGSGMMVLLGVVVVHRKSAMGLAHPPKHAMRLQWCNTLGRCPYLALLLLPLNPNNKEARAILEDAGHGTSEVLIFKICCLPGVKVQQLRQLGALP